MNLLDLLVLLLMAVALVAGARAGFLGPVLGLIGATGGFLLALIAVSLFQDVLIGIEQPGRALVTVLGLSAFVLMGEAIGAAIGTTMSRGLRFSPLRPIDALGGAVVGAAHVVLFVWLLGGMLTMGMAPNLGDTARESVAVRLVTDRLPPPTIVAGRLVALLATTDLPTLFAGVEPPPASPVALPTDAETRALAEGALGSTGRVASGGCGAGLSVGSAFFVSRTHAVTNAHVVAGSDATTVTIGGTDRPASVVAFDAVADLALLYVAGASAPPLTLSAALPERGTAAAALGYPGGGGLTVTAAGVTATHEIPGPDIYGDGVYTRSVVELHAEIRQGNSGGPLVVGPGVVGGIIFGASRTSPEVGYAIGSDEAVERIGPYVGSTVAVDTGDCL